MIGVLFPAETSAAVAEFFELFKTPWEPYQAGREYEVVIATVNNVPEIHPPLLIVFGSDDCSVDARWGFRSGPQRRGVVLELGEMRLPIYGTVLMFEEAGNARACALLEGQLAGITKEFEDHKVLRLGYDLFKEVQYLLVHGQPVQHATVPTLDLHIDLLRRWILEAGLPLVEIPPVPAGNSFTVCLTHDIDFIGIRQHRFDHTMWGFLLRATVGALQRFFRGRVGPGDLARSWGAAISLPLVQLGLMKDYWLPFPWYLNVEKGLGATYYLIPFKRRAGDKVSSNHAERRASAYDVSDVSDWVGQLQQAGCEVGVHGIDAWHSVENGKEERQRIDSVTGDSMTGIRMHWLLSDADTLRVLEEAGYDYDSTVGYNETPGYRAGTGQVYRPIGAKRLLELPMHIQDGALFFPQRLDLSETAAWDLCATFINHARTHGGVLTTIWHDRSHGPERFWGGFYVRLVDELKKQDAWFGTGSEVVEWFRARRSVTFERRSGSDGVERMLAKNSGAMPKRPFAIRTHRAAHEATDVSWSGDGAAEVAPHQEKERTFSGAL
jgi:hypothetical protein